MRIRVAQIGIGHDHADVILDSLLAQDDILPKNRAIYR